MRVMRVHRRRLEVEARVRSALESRELEQVQAAEQLAGSIDGVSLELLDEIRNVSACVCRAKVLIHCRH